MLVLTRKIHETITIGDEVEVTVVRINGDRVGLGVNAPRHVAVHRHEVFRAIQEENRRAAGSLGSVDLGRLGSRLFAAGKERGRRAPPPEA